MSLDISIGGESFNYTHNVVSMWMQAGCYDALYNSDGIKAKHLLPFLKKGLKLMTEKPEVFKKLNPPNKWGDYEGSVDFLERVINACLQNKESKVRISK